MSYSRQWLKEAKRTAYGKRQIRAGALLCALVIAASVCGCVSVTHGHTVNSTVVAVITAEPSPTPSPTTTVTATPIPQTASSINATVVDTPTSEEWIEKNFSWEYKGVQWGFHESISRSIYEFYKSEPHDTTSNYADYALTGEDKDFFSDITKKLKDNGDANGYSGYDQAMNVLAFVQSIPYKEDDVEYTRYPIETLADDAGDCKDKAILAATMLHEMGYDVVLLKFPKHMALGIKIDSAGAYYDYGGSRYYYAETTGENWNIGDIPDGLKGVMPTILPMIKDPRVEASLDVEPTGAKGQDSDYMVHCTLKNDGPGMAVNLTAHVYALALDRGANYIWVPDRYVAIGDYAEGRSGNFDTALSIPAGERTQIVCTITGDNIDTYEMKTQVFYG